MDVELNEDEEEIRQKLAQAQPPYQKAFALIVAERLLSSLSAYIPPYWHVSAESAVKEGWLCLSDPKTDDVHFVHCCKKLRAEEIGMNENPVIDHVMKSVDVSIGVCEGDLQLDDLVAELHHLVRVVESTAKHPDAVAASVGAEKDYVYAVADACIAADQLTYPSREKLTAGLQHPKTTLFGTPDAE